MFLHFLNSMLSPWFKVACDEMFSVVPPQVQQELWVQVAFQDSKGTEEIQVLCILANPHLENLENQDSLDSEDLKENQGVQVP